MPNPYENYKSMEYFSNSISETDSSKCGNNFYLKEWNGVFLSTSDRSYKKYDVKTKDGKKVQIKYQFIETTKVIPSIINIIEDDIEVERNNKRRRVTDIYEKDSLKFAFEFKSSEDVSEDLSDRNSSKMEEDDDESDSDGGLNDVNATDNNNSIAKKEEKHDVLDYVANNSLDVDIKVNLFNQDKKIVEKFRRLMELIDVDFEKRNSNNNKEYLNCFSRDNLDNDLLNSEVESNNGFSNSNSLSNNCNSHNNLGVENLYQSENVNQMNIDDPEENDLNDENDLNGLDNFFKENIDNSELCDNDIIINDKQPNVCNINDEINNCNADVDIEMKTDSADCNSDPNVKLVIVSNGESVDKKMMLDSASVSDFESDNMSLSERIILKKKKIKLKHDAAGLVLSNKKTISSDSKNVENKMENIVNDNSNDNKIEKEKDNGKKKKKSKSRKNKKRRKLSRKKRLNKPEKRSLREMKTPVSDEMKLKLITPSPPPINMNDVTPNAGVKKFKSIKVLTTTCIVMNRCYNKRSDRWEWVESHRSDVMNCCIRVLGDYQDNDKRQYYIVLMVKYINPYIHDNTPQIKLVAIKNFLGEKSIEAV